MATYTEPNAFCPVCGASVFFYASPFGGRVFFDELGPPWPKHPCTDNAYSPRARESVTRTVVNAARSFGWQRDGWIPVIIERVERIANWSWVTGRRLDKPAVFTRVTPWRDELVPGTPAQVKPLDWYGVGQISWMIYREAGPAPIDEFLVHRTFVAITPDGLRAALAGSAQDMMKAGRAAAFAWGKQDQTSKMTYPSFVSWQIARAWLQRAAEAGSDAARLLLNDGVWRIVK